MVLNSDKTLIEPFRRYTIYLFLIGIPAYSLFYISDYLAYHKFALQIFFVRASVTLFLFILLYLAKRVQLKYMWAIAFAAVLSTSTSITAICMITGEGFNSLYYMGIIQVIVASTLLIQLMFKEYVALLVLVNFQYFFLLRFLPYAPVNLVRNATALFFTSIISLIIHVLINSLIAENNDLQDFLPICMYCKKVKNESGNWDKMEAYFEANTTIMFSQGLCPECLEEYKAGINSETAEQHACRKNSEVEP
jgi:hypothetical protein